MPLVVASKKERRTRRGGWRPPRHVEMATTRRRGVCPLLVTSKREEEHDEEGQGPPRCIEKERRTRRGGLAPSPSWNSNNTTRGMSPSSLRYRNDMGKGTSFPVRCACQSSQNIFFEKKENSRAHLVRPPSTSSTVSSSSRHGRGVVVVAVVGCGVGWWLEKKKRKKN